jgi:hypothetical protein
MKTQRDFCFIWKQIVLLLNKSKGVYMISPLKHYFTSSIEFKGVDDDDVLVT